MPAFALDTRVRFSTIVGRQSNLEDERAQKQLKPFVSSSKDGDVRAAINHTCTGKLHGTKDTKTTGITTTFQKPLRLPMPPLRVHASNTVEYVPETAPLTKRSILGVVPETCQANTGKQAARNGQKATS